MPVIKQQKPPGAGVAPTRNGATVVAGSVLDRIAPVAESKIKRMRASFYGLPKTGKTRLACTFPKPLLIIGTEDGTASVVGTKGVDFVQIETTDEFYQLVSGPVAEGRWVSVVLDTLIGLRDMRVAENLGLKETPTIRPNAKQNKDAYINASGEIRSLLRGLLDLPRVMDLSIVILSQEQTFVGDEEAVSSDLIKPSVGSAGGKSVSDWVFAACDFNGQTLIRSQTRTVTSTVAGKQVNSQIKTGRKEYCLRVSPDEVYRAGFRLPLSFTGDIPEFITDPSYTRIVKLLQGQAI